jgi:hypothetical protein
MIQVSLKNLPDVLRIWCDDKWEDGIGNFEILEKELLKLKLLSRKCVLLYSNPDFEGDDTGDFPPVGAFMKIVARLYFLRELIGETVKVNIVHVKNQKAQSHLETLLNWYTPVNTVLIAKNKEESMELVKSYVSETVT